MIPYGRQDISSSDIDFVCDILRSDFLTQGPMVPAFEEAVANLVGVKCAVAVNSATSALHIACLALGLGPGDVLWTTPNTFVASANCALYCGASIDFVDIDPATYNICVKKLTKKLEAAAVNGILPKIIIPVHFAGQPCDMAAIYALSEKYGFKIIEDASHAVGATYLADTFSNAQEVQNEGGGLGLDCSVNDNDFIKVGSCVNSDITIFSFHPVKIITTGEGGMALTNDKTLYQKMLRFRSHGITSNQSLMDLRPDDEIWNYQQIDLGYNYRMTDIQAALGLSQLTRLHEFVGRRQQLATQYDRLLQELPVITPWQHPSALSSYHLYPVRIQKDLCGLNQRQVYVALYKAGIAVNVHYIPVYRQPYFEAMGFRPGYCSEAELFHKEVISLPMYPSLTDFQQNYVVESLKLIFK
jgi:dTDP-4-amino-4,6-dideoxygalactose transaminase